MSAEYDNTELADEADAAIRGFQEAASREAGVFHHLVTLPTYHTAALSTSDLARDYFGRDGMLAYVRSVQRREIRQGLPCVKHQDMAGSNIGDEHKEYFSGDAALKAGGKDNTMNQFDCPKAPAVVAGKKGKKKVPGKADDSSSSSSDEGIASDGFIRATTAIF